MPQQSAVRSALTVVRLMIETTPYDAVDALLSVRHLSALAPPHVKPIAEEAERAVLRTFLREGTNCDALALYALRRLVVAMERSSLRVVK